MKTPLLIVSMVVLLRLTLAAAAATGAKPAPHAVAGQKIDSGLGELPHHRLWTDPSGKNPMGSPKATRAVKGAKVPAGDDAQDPASTTTLVAGLE